VWEEAEIARSRLDAELHGGLGDEHYLANYNNCGRYLTPQLDTPYSLEYAFALVGSIEGRTVLDYGCGDGQNCLILAAKGARVKAIDISPDLIAIAKRRMAVNGLTGKVEFIIGSAYEVPVPEASVDLVLGIAILHHLDLESASKEVWRVLKPGGRAIFVEPVRSLRIIRWIRALIPYRAPDVSPFERPLTDRELRGFGARFSGMRLKPFVLVTSSLLRLIGPLHRLLGKRALHFDAAALEKLAFLRHLASLRVVELTK
jgi:SAM-dependent methyltransferase